MLRIRSLALACLFGLTLAARAEPERAPERTSVVLYLDADTPAIKGSIAKFEAALKLRSSAPHRVRVVHVPLNVFDHEESARRISTALRDRPALLIATSSESALIAKGVTADVPIVFASWQDPIRVGLVRSLADPGANLTGFTSFVPMDLKRLELLREIAPKARSLGIVIDHWWMQETDGEAILRAAKMQLGLEGRVFVMEKPQDLRVLEGPAAREIDVWYVPPTTLPFEHPAQTMHALAALRRPIMVPTSRFVDIGGLIAYEPKISVDDALGLFAKLAGLILDGVPVSEIPVERPQSFSLAVNVGEARRLGLSLPDSLLRRADRVIDAPIGR